MRPVELGRSRSVPIRPTFFGFYDMCGNVDEWTADFYGPYSQTQRTDPKGPEDGASMVTRGGSWNAAENYLRSSSPVQISGSYKRGLYRLPRCIQSDRVGSTGLLVHTFQRKMINI